MTETQPDAGFSYANMGGKSILFTPKISTYNGYYWQFGDGNTNFLASPMHSYANAGTFNTNLQVTDANGCKETSKQSIVLVSTNVFTLSPDSYQDGEGRVRAVPNPFTNQLILSGNIPNGQVKLNWIDATGRLVLSASATASQGTIKLEGSQLPVQNGFYLLQLIPIAIGTENNEPKTLRLLKE